MPFERSRLGRGFALLSAWSGPAPTPKRRRIAQASRGRCEIRTVTPRGGRASRCRNPGLRRNSATRPRELRGKHPETPHGLDTVVLVAACWLSSWIPSELGSRFSGRFEDETHVVQPRNKRR